VPPSLGVGLPASDVPGKSRGLQEEKVERHAWQGILAALMKLKDAQTRETRERAEESDDAMEM